jgi:hypothetical protein
VDPDVEACLPAALRGPRRRWRRSRMACPAVVHRAGADLADVHGSLAAGLLSVRTRDGQWAYGQAPLAASARLT